MPRAVKLNRASMRAWVGSGLIYLQGPIAKFASFGGNVYFAGLFSYLGLVSLHEVATFFGRG